MLRKQGTDYVFTKQAQSSKWRNLWNVDLYNVFLCYDCPMGSITFDTLKYTERLRAAGVPEQQAKAEAEALRDVLAEAMDASLATKPDVLDLKNDLKLEIAAVRGELSSIKWMMGALIAIAIANFGKQFF